MLNIDITHPYYTHVPHLIKVCEQLACNDAASILELGMGHGSSGVFSYFLNLHKHIHVRSFETHLDWYNECVSTYYNALTNITHTHHHNYDDKYNEISANQYDMIFIDQGDWSDRNKSLNTLKNNTKCFVVHDYDYIAIHWPDTHIMLQQKFKHFCWYTDRQTETTLVCTK